MRVRILGDGPDNLLGQGEIALAEPERGVEDPAPRHFALEGGGTGRRGEVRLKLEGFTRREDVVAFEGWWVTVLAAELPELPEDEFYWYQLVGCEVALEDGVTLGRVSEIWQTGAHDVLVVKDPRGRRHLIPTARDIVREIDLEAGRITVAALPGLVALD